MIGKLFFHENVLIKDKEEKKGVGMFTYIVEPKNWI